MKTPSYTPVQFFDAHLGFGGLFVTGIGHGQGKPFEPAWRRTLNCYGLIFLQKGTGYYKSISQPLLELPEGSAFFIFPGEWHNYGPQERWTESWALFTGPFADHLRQTGTLSPTQPLYPNQDAARILQLFEEGRYFGQQAGNSARLRLTAVLFSLLCEILGKSGLQPTDHPNPVQLVADAVRLQPEKAWTPEGMALEAGMSYPLFRKKFVEATTLPPYQFILSEKMKKAAALLAVGGSVQATALTVGFPDAYHFSRLFKKVMGSAPKNFQRFLS